VDDRPFYIGFGSGLKLLSEEWYIKEMGPEITKRSFRSFCRALGVPLIEIGKSTFVEMNSFQLALKAITRVGQPDFYVSGSKSIARGKAKASKLDPKYVADNLEPILCELLASRTLGGKSLTSETKSAARSAADRMARAGVSELSEQAQAKYTKKAIRIFGSSVGRAHEPFSDEEPNPEEPNAG
jgi:hypothetical protein